MEMDTASLQAVQNETARRSLDFKMFQLERDIRSASNVGMLLTMIFKI